MAELTTEDRNNYKKLIDAFGKVLNPDSAYVLRILLNHPIKNTADLHQKIDLLDIYLEMQSEASQVLEFSEDAEQQFVDSFEKLKRSLEAVESEAFDLTDGVEDSSSISLILGILRKISNPAIEKIYIKSTKILLKNGDFDSNTVDINKLTKAWGIAASTFVDDASSEKDGGVIPLQPAAFVSFFRIHSELENLYSNLTDTGIFQASP